MLDCHRDFRRAEPVVFEDHQDAIMALKKFHGTDYIELIYADSIVNQRAQDISPDFNSW